MPTLFQQLQNETTWQRYIAKTSIADKIGTAAALPHPALGEFFKSFLRSVYNIIQQ